jgi:hypothetical protein
MDFTGTRHFLQHLHNACVRPILTSMRLLTARVLLLLLSGISLAQPLVAVAAPNPHACCLRKMHHRVSTRVEAHASAECCGRDCCRPLRVPQFNAVLFRQFLYPIAIQANLISSPRLVFAPSARFSAHFVRGPPCA